MQDKQVLNDIRMNIFVGKLAYCPMIKRDNHIGPFACVRSVTTKALSSDMPDGSAFWAFTPLPFHKRDTYWDKGQIALLK